MSFKLYAARNLTLASGKVIKKGDVIAEVQTDLNVDQVVQGVSSGQLVLELPQDDAKPAPEKIASVKPAAEPAAKTASAK